MNETITIYQAINNILEQHRKAVLATVVRTSGSTYRKEGAKMLITDDGEATGSISAGCLEADVREIAQDVMRTAKPRLLRYDNTASEDIIWGLGLGCNGIVEVFVERVG